jgi:hypothetical protein
MLLGLGGSEGGEGTCCCGGGGGGGGSARFDSPAGEEFCC